MVGDFDEIEVTGIYSCLNWSLVFSEQHLDYFPESTFNELGNNCRLVLRLDKCNVEYSLHGNVSITSCQKKCWKMAFWENPYLIIIHSLKRYLSNSTE